MSKGKEKRKSEEKKKPQKSIKEKRKLKKGKGLIQVGKDNNYDKQQDFAFYTRYFRF